MRGDDVAHTLRLVVTARNKEGASSAISAATAAVTALPAQAPHNTVLPAISGSPVPGQVLTAAPGTWTGATPIGFSYRWRRCDAAGGDCKNTPVRATTYKLSSDDADHALRAVVTATNAAGTSASISDPSPTVARPSKPVPARPQSTSAPKISGTPQQGQTLKGDRGTWANNPSRFDYSWIRCDQAGAYCNETGARGSSYTLTSADIGHTIRFKVTAKNAGGSTTAFSAATAVVATAPATKAAPPANTAPPTISGTAQEGKTLTGDKGTWSNSPTDFDYFWLRCDTNGGSCAAISGARSTTYALTSADVGNTIRFQVRAANSEGSTTETSVPTAVIQKAVAPPARGNGCPTDNVFLDQVATISPPARLIVDTHLSDPRVVTGATNTLVVRFHVTSTCGRPVQGALVYATPTPYNQFAIPPEQPTGPAGWATLVFRRLQGFPVSPRQQLITMFVRARKPGESLLGGISARRLVSLRVRLG